LKKTYEDAEKFCREWGGSLLKFSDETWPKAITDRYEQSDSIYWDSTENKNDGDCTQFGLAFVSKAKCTKKNQFVCK